MQHSHPDLEFPPTEHFKKLERLYLRAPTNVFYQPGITIGPGKASVVIPVRPEFFHAASAVHGSVCFKALDDAAFFAANSAVEDVFVYTVSFSVTFVRPVSQGKITATGELVHVSRRLLLGESTARDDEGRLVATGSGTFMRSSIRLGPELGYL